MTISFLVSPRVWTLKCACSQFYAFIDAVTFPWHALTLLYTCLVVLHLLGSNPSVTSFQKRLLLIPAPRAPLILCAFLLGILCPSEYSVRWQALGGQEQVLIGQYLLEYVEQHPALGLPWTRGAQVPADSESFSLVARAFHLHNRHKGQSTPFYGWEI